MTRFRAFALALVFVAACDGHVDINEGNPEAGVPANDAMAAQDGAESTTDGTVPDGDGAVPTEEDGIALAIAHNTTCAIRGATLYCWGSNDYGQFGNGARDMEPLSDHPHATPVATAYVGARSVALSRWASYVVTADHELWVSGLNNHGQLPFETKSPRQVEGIAAVDLAAGTYRVGCVVTQDTGEVRCMGDNEYGEVGDGSGDDQAGFVATGLTDVTSLSGGYEFLCAVSDGDVYCWGHNDKGQIGNGAGGDGVIQTTPVKVALPGTVVSVAAGHQHACAVLQTGNVYCWGINWGHQAGASSDANKCGAHDCLRSPQQVGGVTDAVQVAAADAASCAVRAGGGVKCWGDAALTQGAPSLAGVVAVASGHEASHFCARIELQDAAAEVKCWGASDTQGKLGRGTVITDGTTQRTPATVAFPD